MKTEIRIDPASGYQYEVYGPRIPWYKYDGRHGGMETPTTQAPPLTSSIESLDFNTTGFIEGYNGFGAIPADPTGGVGPNHVVSAVNSTIRWTDKSGGNAVTRRLGADANDIITGAFFDMPGTANDPQTGMFDPRVLYDQYAGRFVVLAGELRSTLFGDPVNESAIFIAVSHTSDPNGGWTLARYDTKVNIGGADTWLDFPALAVDSQAIYVTGNFFTFDFQSNPGSRLMIIPKGIGSGGIYDPNGTSAATFYNAAGLSGTSHTVMIPAHMFGAAPTGVGTFLARYSGFTDGTNEFISIIRVNNPLSSPTFTHQFVSVGNIDVTGPAIPDAGQLNGPAGIDTGDRRALNVSWRNNSLYFTSTVLPPPPSPDVAQATAHWFHVNTSNLASLTLTQQGNISGNDIAADCPTFYGAMAIDNAGNIGFGFGASTFSIYAGFYYTLRLASDPTGTVQSSGTVMAGQDIYVRRYGGADNRWGDYFSAALDPVDESFWVYGKYARIRGFTDVNGEQGIWGTRWGHFEVPFSGLRVSAIGPVNPNVRNTAIDTIDVTFSEAIQAATFTMADVALTRNGTAVSFSGNESIAFVSGTTYRISGLSQETAAAGGYVLTVNAATIQNSSGQAGFGVRNEIWHVDLAGPSVVEVVGVTPNPSAAAISSIVVRFSEAVALASFTAADITLTRNGSPVSFSGNETFARVTGAPLPYYTIGGLAEETAFNGDYLLTVFGAGITDLAGNSGSGSASTSFTVQFTGQAVIDVIDVDPDPRNTPVPFIDVVFSGPINLATFTTADITLTRNGSPVSFSGNETFTLISGATYRVGGLSEETAAQGTYVFTVFGAGVFDLSGNPGTGSASDSWVCDLTGPTVIDVLDVLPDPRNISVSFIDVLFSESIDLSTFTVADLSLTRNGSPIAFSGNETFTLVSGTTYRVGGLAEETAAEGAYVFTVLASGIADLVGNFGSGSAQDNWTMDLTGPTVTDVIDVAPDPRNSPVSFIDVVFSEVINLASFTAADVALTRDGNSVTFSGNETFAFVSGTTYRIGGLSEETAASGVYVLTVFGAGILDLAGNSGAGSASDTWTTDATPPTVVSVGPVVPNPRNSVVSAVAVQFSETINLATFTVADLLLTRNGSPVGFSGNETFTLVSGSTYQIGGLAEETGLDGNYVLTVFAAGIFDLVGNAGTGSAATNWAADFTPPAVVAVVEVSPDPRNTPVPSIDVVFSELINLATFTAADVVLTRNGLPVAFSGNETFTFVSGTTYRIGGLTEETNADGVYTLTVSAAGIADLVGNFGSNFALDSFVIDVTPPQVVSVGPVVPNPRTSPIAFIDVVFSEPIILSTFTLADVSLLRDGSPVSFSGNETISHVAGTTFRISGLEEETAAAGGYLLTVDATGIQDPFFNAGVGSASASWNVTTSGDLESPAVANVYFAGSVWAAGFLSAAGSSSGFPAQTGAGQLVSMPWSNINVIRIQFTENVVIAQGDLSLRGLNNATYAFAGFGYDSVNFIASWTLVSSLPTDRLILDLDGNAVEDGSGNKLAGDWTEGVSGFPSGGSAGTSFLFRFVVAVGDATRDGLIRNADLNLVRSNLFIDFGQSAYNIFADIDGNGLIRNADVNAVRARLFDDPPSGPGPFRNVRGRAPRETATNRIVRSSFRSEPNGSQATEARVNRRPAPGRPDLPLSAEALDSVFAIW